MDITDLRRKDFETWIASHNTKSFDKQDEELLKNGLTKIGITIQSI